MHKTDFDYALPPELIAQYPVPNRVSSRLMVLEKRHDTIAHRVFADVVDLLSPGDALILNNSAVIPARLCAQKPTGGQVEILVERLLPDANQGLPSVRALLRSYKATATDKRLHILDPDTRDLVAEAEVVFSHGDGLFTVSLPAQSDWLTVLQRWGRPPLPHYIERTTEEADTERYQTVYGTRPGSVAVPSAGLHFDEDLLARIQEKGIHIGYVTLHVGLGTFQPVRVSDIREHRMHSEWLVVPESVATLCQQTRLAGKRIVAVGTTTVRSLETALRHHGGEWAAYQGESDLFIYPGYTCTAFDVLITNFHLPQSTLLMLVSAFAGTAFILRAYQEAVKAGYRFFSYGDAMWVE